MNHETKWVELLTTKLSCIAHRSKQGENFDYLIQLVTVENLEVCFHELDRNKAVGVDLKSKDDYAENLKSNLDVLISKMKSMSYRPGVVRETFIPKANGKLRPLGIANIEDKIVQSLFAKILMAIYEPHFKDFSYGFRPQRNCHQAIKRVWSESVKTQNKVIIDVDLQNYFGEIEHQKLNKILELRIKDKVFLQYIQRMLKVNILSEGVLRKNLKGVPQGSILGPVLSNIFAHYIIDLWFDYSVRMNLFGKGSLTRYCDDIIITLTDERDSERVLSALKGRLGRAALKLNSEKTKIVPFGRGLNKDQTSGTFNFLGFTFYMSKTLKGFPTVKIKTTKTALCNKLKEISNWCRSVRNLVKLKDWWKVFRAKIEGHIQYFSVSFNTGEVTKFIHKARRIFFKWCNRRSQRNSFSWDKFLLFEKQLPLSKVRVVHKLF